MSPEDTLREALTVDDLRAWLRHGCGGYRFVAALDRLIAERDNACENALKQRDKAFAYRGEVARLKDALKACGEAWADFGNNVCVNIPPAHGAKREWDYIEDYVQSVLGENPQ